MTYLTEHDPDAFAEMDIKPQPGLKYPDMAGRNTLCPRCQGYGGWHLELNAYGAGRHFDCGCPQCNGWGWVDERDATCIHAYVEISHKRAREIGLSPWGSFCHVYKCSQCGRTAMYDTSD